MPNPDLTTQPNPEVLLQWRNSLVAEWGSLTDDAGVDGSLEQAMQEEEDLYFQRFDVMAPYGKMGFRTGSAAADADAAVDSLVPSDILVSVRAARDRKKYKRQAEKLQLFGKALLTLWDRDRAEFRRIISDQVIRRVGVCRVLFDRTLWPDFPEELQEINKPQRPDGESSQHEDREMVEEDDDDERELDEFEEKLENWSDKRTNWEVRNRRKCPIILEHRNPRFVRWRDYRGRMIVVVEHYPTTVLEAQTAFGHLPQAAEILRGRDAQDVVYVSDVWYQAWRGIFLDDEPIYPGGVVEHGYPRIPYFVLPFRELPFESPALRYRGMLTNSRDLYPMESQVLTMNVWLLAWNAWRTYIGWTTDARPIEIIPGQFLPIDKRRGEWIEMLDGRPVPPELLQMAGVVDSFIQRNGVAQGPRTTEGTRSGTQVWAIQAMRQLKIESAKTALQREMSNMVSLAAEILETMVQEPIILPVPGKTRDGADYGEVVVGPDDINGYYDGFKVVFARRLDPALLEQAKALMAMSTNNWMPHETSVELSGLSDNPSEWMDQLLEQSSDRLDFMLEYHALARMRETEGEDSDIYKLFWQHVYQSHVNPQGGAPSPAAAPAGAPGVPSRGGITPASPKGPLDASMPGENPMRGLDQGIQTKTSARPRGNQRRMAPPGIARGGPAGGAGGL